MIDKFQTGDNVRLGPGAVYKSWYRGGPIIQGGATGEVIGLCANGEVRVMINRAEWRIKPKHLGFAETGNGKRSRDEQD